MRLAGGVVLEKDWNLMCKCIRYWEVDRRVESTHDRVPITCDEYTDALKILLKEWLDATEGRERELEIVTREVLAIGNGQR